MDRNHTTVYQWLVTLGFLGFIAVLSSGCVSEYAFVETNKPFATATIENQDPNNPGNSSSGSGSGSSSSGSGTGSSSGIGGSSSGSGSSSSGSGAGSSSSSSSGGNVIVQAHDVFNPAALGTAPKVDMLFVVDNSGSMSDEQAMLADSFQTFIDQFMLRNVDFHIGIITTDVTDPSNTTYWNSSRFSGYQQPSRGRLLSRYAGEKWLTRNSVNLAAKFRDNVRVGTSGSGQEQGMYSASFALDAAMTSNGGFNEGFIRPDALLSVIMVTDEDEDIRNGDTLAQRIARMSNAVMGLKGPTSPGFRYDFIINLSAAAPATPVTYPLASGTNYYPNAYLAAASQLVGNQFNVARNFGSDLVDIGGGIINQAEREFRLAHTPIAGSIVVQIDGQFVPEDAGNGWIFHAANNTVELVGSALAQSPGTTLTIDYQYNQ